ncbi:MAG TPA: hypothetical protein VGX03_10465 [Candidatus Binatia bacterium]|jgi:hypothetical protein|nr:hypothetical protein [Candidatus Binatia bacterium]
MHRSHLVLLLAAGVLFLWGANRQSTLVNTNMQRTDQFAYMNYAKQLAQTDFQYVGERNRMPLYPGIMALFYRDGMSDEDFFARGKQVGIALGLVVLLMAFAVFKRGARTEDALTALLVAMFTVFAYKSPYFQTEVLFYGITLLLFVLLLSLLRHPRVRTAGLAGLVGGLAHLTKASVLPALFLGVACLLIRAGVDLRRHRSGQNLQREQPSSSRSVLIAPLGCACVLLAIFLLVIFPYIRTSKARFGHYFYNVNSTFYLWYDSWTEAEQGTKAHGDRVGWPVMPEEDIPSLRKYLHEHSLGDIVGRFLGGVGVILSTVIRSYGYAWFVILYLVALIALSGQNGGPLHFLAVFWRANPSLVLFVAAYFLGYLALYAWFTRIASGNRIVLAQFLPALFLIIRSLSYAQKHNLAIRVFGRRVPASAISPALLLILGLYLCFVFPHRISTKYGGE